MRNTLYLSTTRTEGAVRDAFDRCQAPTGDPVVEYVPGEAQIDNARQMFMGLEGEWNLVIDPVDTLERGDRTRYQKFLNELQNHMRNTGSVAMLHCMVGETTPDTRKLTTQMADVIFDLRVAYKGAEVDSRLAVPKFRGGRALDETIKLELADRVRVDTSRDIA